MENDGIEKRLQDLENRVQELEWEAIRNRPLGPGHAEKGPDPEVVERLVNSAKTIRDAESEIPPVDRSKRCMTSGNPEAPDHREIDPRTGMQKDYVVLCPDERAKGFVRSVRRTYLHLPCKTTTTMGLAIAETYARDPKFYSGTFCCSCRAHFPLDQFVWEGTEEMLGT